MPPESKPVEVSEMKPVLETAMASIQKAADAYLAGEGLGFCFWYTQKTKKDFLIDDL